MEEQGYLAKEVERINKELANINIKAMFDCATAEELIKKILKNMELAEGEI